MNTGLYWQYRNEDTLVLLNESEEEVGLIKVIRDSQEIINQGKELSFNPTYVNNHIEFLDRASDCPGLNPEDIKSLPPLAPKFLTLGSYQKHKSDPKVICRYIPDEQRRKSIKELNRILKEELLKRFPKDTDIDPYNLFPEEFK